MLKNYAVCNVQCSEFFYFYFEKSFSKITLTVFLKAFISKGVRYLTVKSPVLNNTLTDMSRSVVHPYY